MGEERAGRSQAFKKSEIWTGEAGAERIGVSEPAGQSRGPGQLHQVRTHSLEVERPQDERAVPAGTLHQAEL